MRLRILCVLALLLSTLPVGTSLAKSVSKEFQEAWAEREQRYAARMEEARTQLPIAMAALNSPGNDESSTKARLDHLLKVTFELGYNSARAQVLSDTQAFIYRKPSPARAQLWLQEQAEKLRERAQSAESKAETVKNQKLGLDGATTQTMLRNMGLAVFETATVKGMADEIGLIDQNLTLYYPAKDAEDQRRRQSRAAILGAIGKSMQETANQGWMATCTRAGPTTTCMGN